MKKAAFVPSLTKSDLIGNLFKSNRHLPNKDVRMAINHLIKMMSNSLSTGERIEIRGFGSFCLHYSPPRIGRNPKPGDSVNLLGKHVPHFKPGKELRDRVKKR